MSRPTLASLLVAAIATIATIAAPARAEPSDAERKAAAQALFDAARVLTSEGRYADACPKLEESVSLDATAGSKFYLAECFEHVGKLASAWTYYLDAADSSKAAGSPDREKFARDRADAVSLRITRIVVSVSPEARATPGLVVVRDHVTLGEGQWDVPIPVDPGRHDFSASAPNKLGWESTIEVSEPGKTIAVIVPPLTAQAPPTIAPLARAPALAAPADLPPKPSSPARRFVGVGVGVVGLTLLGVGAGFGLDASSKQAQSNEDNRCDAQNRCDAAGLALRHDAIGSATVSTIGFVAGGALLAGGVILVLTAPSAPSAPSAPPPVSVTLAPGSLVFSGRF